VTKGKKPMQHPVSTPALFAKKCKYACLTLIALSFVFLAAGCAGSAKPAYNIERYLLSWPSPPGDEARRLPVCIKFNRFSIAAAYNSTDMIFRDDDYGFDSFNYSRWAVNPADMIADGIAADMRSVGKYQAVFSRQETAGGRFVISGGIEEFYLRTDKSGKTALISMSVSVEDSLEKGTARILFQKKYLQEERLQETSPRGYARAASRATQKIAHEVVNDVFKAIETRLQ